MDQQPKLAPRAEPLHDPSRTGSTAACDLDRVAAAWQAGWHCCRNPFCTVSMFILLALSVVCVRFGSLPWIAAMFNGINPLSSLW